MGLIFFMNIRNSMKDVNKWRMKSSGFVAFQYGTNLRHFRRNLLSLPYILKHWGSWFLGSIGISLSAWVTSRGRWVNFSHSLCWKPQIAQSRQREAHLGLLLSFSSILKKGCQKSLYSITFWRKRLIRLIDNKHVHCFMH